MEIWKPIPNYEDLYEASSEGRIRSKEGKVTYSHWRGRIRKRVWKSRILKEKNKNGNCGRGDKRVDLWKNRKNKTFLLHRLIAETFIPNPLNKPCVNHIDGNFRNNRVENLEWVTFEENSNHAFDNDLAKTNIKILLVDKHNNQIEFRSMAKASEYLGYNSGYVNGILKKDKHKIDGYNIKIL